MTINLAQQVFLGDLVFQTKVVEQRSGARLLTHHFGVPPESYLAHSNSSHQKKEPFVPSFSTVSFVFGTIDDLEVIVFTGRESHRESLKNQLQQAWVNFARTGDPSQPGLPWSRYDNKTRSTMELGSTSQVVDDPHSEERRLWDDLPFDGVMPNMGKLWSIVWNNGTP